MLHSRFGFEIQASSLEKLPDLTLQDPPLCNDSNWLEIGVLVEQDAHPSHNEEVRIPSGCVHCILYLP